MKPLMSNLLLLGSAGRNSGKTTLACAIITALKDSCAIVAIKITTISSEETGCPRGGEGCGVCKKLESPYELTEETEKTGTKDTQRLLRAGAQKVHWLKTSQECLGESFMAFMRGIGPGALVICESNSLRKYVKPGLFFMLQNKGARSYKSSAKRVKEFADRTISFDGEHFDFDINELSVVDNIWHLR